MLRKCAQSIFRLEITLKSRFLEENRKKNFRVENARPQMFVRKCPSANARPQVSHRLFDDACSFAKDLRKVQISVNI